MQASQSAPLTPQPFVRRWNARRVVVTTLCIVAVIVAFFLIYRFSNVFFVLFVAAVFATAMRPAVLWLERRGVSQRLGVILIYLVLLLLTIGIFASLMPLLLDQGAQMVQNVPGYYQEVREWLQDSNSQI